MFGITFTKLIILYTMMKKKARMTQKHVRVVQKQGKALVSCAVGVTDGFRV